LLVGTPNNATQQQIAEAQQRAQSLLKRALAGESFETLVSKNSDAERNNGGAIGLRSADRLPEPFVDAVQDLPIGGIAPKPLRSNAGFHLLKLLDKQTTTQTLPDVLIQNHARHILRRVDSQDEAEQAEKTFKQFKQQVEKGQADFATLARQHSQDGTAAQGGDLGWTTAGQFVPEFEATLDALHPGEIAQPFLSRFGMHLVQLLERKQTPLTREQKLDAARKTLKARKQEEAYTEWSQEILARAYVEHRAEPDLR
jgi:peptidyl-prolyl cis-trans isomerase SurA